MAKKSNNLKNIILCVGVIPQAYLRAIREYEVEHQKLFRVVSIYDKQAVLTPKERLALKKNDITIPTSFNSTTAIEKALLPYENQLLAVIFFGEKNVPNLKKVIPNVPYLRTPTTESLDWSTDKIQMRQRFNTYNKRITPAFTVVHDETSQSIARIERLVKYPVVVKPAGLAASLLVSICYHREDLEKSLRVTFRSINKLYKEKQGRGTPSVLVEQFMEGTMYSIDAYVSSRGKISFCPLVKVETGRSIGFDDFFGYQRITPTTITPNSAREAEDVAAQGIRALGLRSCACHIELMRTENGWKLIEMGPRVGGYRHKMYSLSYGINHVMNTVNVQIPEKLSIPKKVKGHTSVLQFYARTEGKLSQIKGINKVRKLESLVELNINKKPGDKCLFAKNGGSPVFDVILFNKDRSKLLADVRRLESATQITTTK